MSIFRIHVSSRKRSLQGKDSLRNDTWLARDESREGVQGCVLCVPPNTHIFCPLFRVVHLLVFDVILSCEEFNVMKSKKSRFEVIFSISKESVI